MRRFSTPSWLLIAFIFAGLTACNKTQDQTAQESAGNPADGNLAPASEATQGNAPPPATAQPEYPEAYSPPAGGAYEQPVEASEAPPPLPEYSQPPCPGDNYVWTPGYWAWSSGYYWVPGTWVMAPWVGALWTPPWWGYQNSVYIWHAGYWAPHIGFYGGIDYGFGYPGRGYYGAYWNHGRVFYNRTATNVNITVIHNFYEAPVPRVQVTRTSYNGGHGGIDARPTPQEQAVSRDPRLASVPAQVQHARQAVANRAQFVGVGNQRPAVLVATRPLPTSSSAPEARPPEAAVRVAARPTSEPSRPAPETARPTPAAARPELPPGQPGRGPAAQRPVPPERAGNQPAPEIRTPVPEPRKGQVERTTPPPRPEQPTRPEPQRAASPRPEPPVQPQQRTVAPRPDQQVQPQQRTVAPRPDQQVQPQQRTVAPRPEQQVQPQQRTAPPRPEQQVQPQQRTAPPRPEQQVRPEPQRAPAARPSVPEEKRKDEQR
jgi:hypothetical protein